MIINIATHFLVTGWHRCPVNHSVARQCRDTLKLFNYFLNVYLGANSYAGCTYCTHLGEYSNTLQKIIYPGNRRFLRKDDKLRKDKKNFPCQKIDNTDHPEIKTMQYIDKAIMEYSSAESIAQKRQIFQKTGCKGPYALRKLYLHERIKNTPIDPMHLIKNIVSHCVNLIAGHEDSYKVRAEEKIRKRFPSSWVTKKSSTTLPDAPFSLSKDDITLADNRARRILVPSGFDWIPRPIFSKTTGMKSHEWKQIATKGVLKFCLRGMLGRNQRKTLYKLFDLLQCICDDQVNNDSIDELEEEVHTVLALIERDFPVSMQVIVFHLLHHLPFYLKRFGPVHSFWMYNYERFNSWITRRCLNRRHPESTVIETYRLAEWANFLELSGQLCKGTIRSCQDTSEADEYEHHLQGSNNSITLTDEQMKQVKCHYLESIPEFSQLTEQYKDELSKAKDIQLFPSMSEWSSKNSLLSSHQRKICNDLSRECEKLSTITYKDPYNRSVTLSSMESDCEHTYRRCSYVSSANTTSPMVGRVVTLFEHIFMSTATRFAYVSWFDSLHYDSDSGLAYVLASVQTQIVVPVKALSRPLVVAFDDEEPEQLWILNF